LISVERAANITFFVSHAWPFLQANTGASTVLLDESDVHVLKGAFYNLKSAARLTRFGLVDAARQF
jgi:hypothetical protein